MATRILFFGRLRDAAGCAERVVEIGSDDVTLAALASIVSEGDETLKAALLSPLVNVAIDRVIVRDPGAVVAGAEEIAFMPPFSGG